MEEDRTYIAKKCAEVRGQFDHVMKMARDALALCHICEGIRQLQRLFQQHRFVHFVQPNVRQCMLLQNQGLLVENCAYSLYAYGFVNGNYWTIIDIE